MKILNWIFKRPAETVVITETSVIEELPLNPKDVKNPESNQEFSKSSILSSEDKNRYIEMIANGEALDSSFDSLFEEAARLIVMHQQGSMSLIQRKLSLGYNRAGRIIDQLELAQIIGPSDGSKARKVLIDDEEKLERHLQSIGFPFSLNDLYEENKSEIDRRRLEIEEFKRIEADRFEKERIKSKLLKKERMKTLEKEAIKELIEEGKIKQ